MRVLVIGSGGREHALVWKLRRSPRVQALYCAPGNAGIAADAECVPIAADDLPGLVRFAREAAIDLTVVGPELPLTLGLVDRFAAAGLRAFGPTAAAARLEGSKAFTKELCHQHHVPSAAFGVFRDPADATAYIREVGAPVVVKADGLASGKGVFICPTVAEATRAVDELMRGRVFGDAGTQVVVEEFLEGEELSVLALTDGERVLILPPAQDHKRLGEGDTGPNTGGMGAYCPVSLATDALVARVRTEIFEPVLREVAAQGSPYEGVLYAGLMILPDGTPSVLEFNARFGDPETQALLPALLPGFSEHIVAIAQRRWDPLPTQQVLAVDQAAVTTVLAARGYPDNPEKGVAIRLPDVKELGEDVIVFHAGTFRDNEGRLRTNGGRVLSVTGLGATVAIAAQASRAGAERIAFEGKTWRRDIAWREIQRAGAA